MKAVARALVAITLLPVCACGDDVASMPDAAIAGDPDAAAPDAPLDQDIAARLERIDGMTVIEEGTTELDGYRYFVLTYRQPEDHDQPGGAQFEQLLTLLHRDESAPFILATTGYGNWGGDQLWELTRSLGGNQLVVEHRFFGTSIAAEPDWSRLNIRQAAADHHRLVEALSPIYTGKWLSTGASKGGMTSVFHRRFHPDDVDGTVAYVAPISFDYPDMRYDGFFAVVGPDECRTAVREYQRELLTRRAAMESRSIDWAELNGWTFEQISIEYAFEASVFGFEWTYWQYFGDSFCQYVPANDAPDSQLFEVLQWVEPLEWYRDGSDRFTQFYPYYVQAATELGAPGKTDPHLEEFRLHTDPESTEPPESYSPTAMQDVQSWVTESGGELMFIYGQWDPWTAGAYELGGATDSHSYVAPRANHGANLASLDQGDQSHALEVLESWTGVVPELTEPAFWAPNAPVGTLPPPTSLAGQRPPL